jgi:hypothetical protein
MRNILRVLTGAKQANRKEKSEIYYAFSRISLDGRGDGRYLPPPMTRIEQFRKLHSVKPLALARASGLSPRMVELIRKGNNTTIESAKALAIGFTKLLRRRVDVGEIFDLSFTLPSPEIAIRRIAMTADAKNGKRAQ